MWAGLAVLGGGEEGMDSVCCVQLVTTLSMWVLVVHSESEAQGPFSITFSITFTTTVKAKGRVAVWNYRHTTLSPSNPFQMVVRLIPVLLVPISNTTIPYTGALS